MFTVVPNVIINEEEAALEASYQLAFDIVKNNKTYSDGEFAKSLILTAYKKVYPEVLHKYKKNNQLTNDFTKTCRFTDTTLQITTTTNNHVYLLLVC